MGYRIEEIRKSKRMTQQELAEKSGISRTTISLLESGQAKNASTKTLLALSAALGVSVDVLFFSENV